MNLETPRLQLRPLTEADTTFIIELVNQPGWLANIGDRNIHTREAALAYIEKGPAASLARHGFGLLAVTLKSTGEAIGLSGLIRRDTLDAPDLGYALLGRHERQGYAVEACRAVLDWADTQGIPRLLAIVLPSNTASVAVLRKLGFVSRGLAAPTGEGPALEHFERHRRAPGSGPIQTG